MKDQRLPDIDALSIKEGFYQLPIPQNIAVKPGYPYSLGHQGAIHSNYLIKILEILTTKSSPESKERDFAQLLYGHALESILSELDFEGIVDYFRHLIHLNRDELGWEVADVILKEFARISPPRWELPGSEMDRGFREGLFAIFEWKTTSKEKELLEAFVGEVRVFSGRDLSNNAELEEIILNIDKPVWNVRGLYSLYETLNLMIYQYTAIEQTTYSELIKRLEERFEELLAGKNVSMAAKRTIGLLLINGLLQKTEQDLVLAKSKLEAMWERFRRGGATSGDEFQWVYGSVYVKIVGKLYDFEREVVTRRMLLRDILDNYIKPDMIKYRRWKAHLLHTSPHPWLFCLLTTGYASMLNTVKEHLLDLPPEADKKALLSIHKNLSSFVFDFITQYLVGRDEDKQDHPQMGYKIISVMSSLRLPPGSLQELQVAIHLAIKNKIIHAQDISPSEREELLEMGFLVSERLFSERFNVLFRTDMELSFDIIPFANLITKIVAEAERYSSLLHSHTFEEEVINRFAVMFELVKNQLRVSLELERYFYEVMLWFLAEWYWNLRGNKDIKAELNMILPPFIGIMIQRLAIYYLERNQPIKAQLMLINHYLFSQISDHRGRRLEKIPREGAVSKIVAQLVEIKEELEVEIDPQEFNLKKMASFDLSASTATVGSAEEAVPLALNDELFVSYLGLSDQLNQFLQLLEGADQITARQLILDNEIFELPRDFSIHIMEKIGRCSPPDIVQRFPFPIIRNLNSTAIAIQLFPLTSGFPDFTIEEQ